MIRRTGRRSGFGVDLRLRFWSLGFRVWGLFKVEVLELWKSGL